RQGANAPRRVILLGALAPWRELFLASPLPSDYLLLRPPPDDPFRSLAARGNVFLEHDPRNVLSPGRPIDGGSAMMLCCFWGRGVLLLLLVLLPAVLFAEQPAGQAKPDKLWVYIGTYTQKGSKGIYRCELDPATGKLSAPVVAGQTANPSFLAIHPNHRFLYAVGEISDFGGKKTGAVSAFAIDPKTGELTLLNQQSSGGAGPCHVTVDREGKNVLAANYGGGSACVLPIGADGKLREATAVAQHKGSSVNPKRQEGPHAHSINLD